jgi:hypothetical protein
MKLKRTYAAEDEIPAGYADLYTVRNGQYVLTEIEAETPPAEGGALRNPFDPKHWGTLADRAAYLAKHGLKATEAAAAKFGCTMASTKPNPRFK